MTPDPHHPNPYDPPKRTKAELADTFCDWLRENDRETKQREYRQYLAAVRECDALMFQYRITNP